MATQEERYDEAIALYGEENYAKAIPMLEALTNEGYEAARYDLGVSYYNGTGVPQDFNKAVKLWQEGADKGIEAAQTNLAACYLNGQGVKQDYAKAVELFRKAADKGLALAQYNMGYCYQQGYGVPKDDAKAKEWFQKAADQGMEEAKALVGGKSGKGGKYKLPIIGAVVLGLALFAPTGNILLLIVGGVVGFFGVKLIIDKLINKQ